MPESDLKHPLHSSFDDVGDTSAVVSPAHAAYGTDKAPEAAAAPQSLSDLRHVSLDAIEAWVEREEGALAKAWARVPTPLVIVAAVLAWLLGGAWFYSVVDHWPFWQSYYYAVNVGYSIGFGAITESSSESHFFSVAFICLGAGALGGALGFLGQLTLERSDEFAKDVRAKEVAPQFGEDVDGDGDVDLTDYGLALVADARAFYRAHENRCNCFLALFAWIAAGVVFGMVDQGWPFETALYFSVSALSTGGLQSVATTTSSDGTTLLTGRFGNTFVSVFVGVFAMTGVPVFGVALGQFAGFFVDSYVQKREEAAMARVLSRDEFDYVRGLGTSAAAGGGGRARESIDFGAFMALELLRLQKIDRGMIATIRDEFDKRDRDGSGDITWEEVEKYHAKQGLLRLGRAAEAKLLMKRKGMTAARAKLKAFQMPDEHVIQRASARHIEMAREMRPDTAFDAEHL